MSSRKIEVFKTDQAPGKPYNQNLVSLPVVLMEADDKDGSSRFTWRIENFSRKHTEEYSDVFSLGGYPWRLLIFPKGNINKKGWVSMYLDVGGSDTLEFDWTRYAEFRFSVINQVNNLHSLHRGILLHTFNRQMKDWGLGSFISLEELLDRNSGFLVNDILVVEVQLIIARVELKPETGCTGLEKLVHFRSLENPKENVFSLNLWMLLSYEEVVRRVARHLGIGDASKMRLMPHNNVSQRPETNMIEYSGAEDLQDILVKNNEVSNILYYEELDVPKIKAGDGAEMQRDPSLCIICLSSPKEGVCLPCGHIASCMLCLNKIKDKKRGCPICRANIQQIARVFIV